MGEQYYIWFPYAKNPATTGTDNTLLSILAFRGYREGDNPCVMYGGEILVGTDENAEKQCSVISEGTFQYNNGVMDSGIAMHIHNDLACITEGTQLLLGADELAPGQEVGLGFKIDPGEPERLPGSSENAPIHFYIDSLGVSIPGMNNRAAPVNSGYEILSGTSMASPAAAASYALLAAQQPRKEGQSGTEYVREMLALFLSSARCTDALKDLCSTGGYIDLSRTEKKYPSISDAVSDIEADTLTLYGQNLTESYRLSVRSLLTGAVTNLPASGMAIEYAEDGEALVIRGARSLFNTVSEFILSDGNDVLARKAYYLVRGQEAPEMVCTWPTDESDFALLTDSAGKTLYAYDLLNSTVSVWNGSSFVSRNNTSIYSAMHARLLSEGWTEEQLDSMEISTISVAHHIRVPARTGNRVYDFVQVQGFPSPDETKFRYYIASMDYTAASPVWEFREAVGYPGPVRISGQEDDRYEPFFISATDGILYLFGSVPDVSSPYTYVLCCDLETGEWTRGRDLSGIALESPYVLADDGKIWIVFASEGEEEKMSRRVYRYDGYEWAILKDLPFVGRHRVQDTVECGYIDASCALSDYGLFMLNCSTEGGGSFFVYDDKTGECLPLYLTLRDGKSDALTASAVLADGSIYTLLRVESLSDQPYEVRLYRIPYRYLYRTAPSYIHAIGSPSDMVITAKRTSVDRLTFDRFRRLTVDGATVAPEYYRKERGSLVLTISADYLDKLAVGEHPAVLSFADGTAETTIVITKPVPKTGDEGSPVLWIFCILLGMLLLRFRNKPPVER